MKPLNVKILLNRQRWKNSRTRVHSAHKKKKTLVFKRSLKFIFERHQMELKKEKRKKKLY